MRLAYDNILMVKALEFQGNKYSWSVSMKSNMVSDQRQYSTGDIYKHYLVSDLPVCVQKFIKKHVPEKKPILNRYGKAIPNFIHYTYK